MTAATPRSGAARTEILARLRQAAPEALPPRPALPPLPEAALAGEAMLQCLMERLAEESCTAFRVRTDQEALERLDAIAREEGLQCVMADQDEATGRLDLDAWGARAGVEVLRPDRCGEPGGYREAVFDRAQAAITGADFAVAETGSLGLVHRQGRPRLVSLAPILHIVLIPAARVVPVLEAAVAPVFARPGEYPSQFTLATGPSLTGDITGYLFRGMHGPRKVIALVLG